MEEEVKKRLVEERMERKHAALMEKEVERQQKERQMTEMRVAHEREMAEMRHQLAMRLDSFKLLVICLNPFNPIGSELCILDLISSSN